MIKVVFSALLTFTFCASLPAGADNVTSPADYIDSLGGKVDYWHAEKMPLRVFIVADPRLPNYRPVFKDYFLEACRSWADASQGKVSFKFVSAEPCDIKVTWTNDTTQVLNTGELGQSDWTNNQNGLLRATIKLLTVAENGRRAINDQEAKLMCLHELGHALGLVKHSPYLGDIMNAAIDYNYNTPVEKLQLSRRDKNTIARLYQEGDDIVEKLSAASADPRAKLMRLCFRGAGLVRDGKYDSAYVLLERALAIDPKCVPALSAMGECCFYQGMDCYSSGNYSTAVQRLEKFISVSDALKMSGSSEVAEAKKTIEHCKSKMGPK